MSSNLMFDDFIELDLFDPSEPSNGLFSFYLNSATGLDDSSPDLGAAAAALAAPQDDQALPMDLEIKQEDDSTTSPMLLSSPPLDSVDLPADTHQPTHVFAEPMALISPDQLSIVPQATISLPLASSVPSSASATAISSATAAVTSAIESALSLNTSSTAMKRSSPEPSSPPRKHAKTESVSKKVSTSTAKRSSISAASSSPAAMTNGTSTSSSTSSSPSSPSVSCSSPEPTVASLTSPVNTTLSPATLQFLLQQQEETPLVPQLFTGKLSREEIEATLARLLESTKHLIASPEESKSKDESLPSDDESDDNDMDSGSMQTHGLKTQPGIKTDDIPSSTDLKKMTSKERRQLRNKISARNFRVRRKEYIYTLEGQVQQHKTEARHLREAVTVIQEENHRLKNELEMVRRQLAEVAIVNGAATAATPEHAQSNGSMAPLSKESQSLLSSLLNRNATSTINSNAKSLSLAVTRPQSPILTPNLHKDVPNSSSGSTSQTSWKDKNPIMVHTTLVPEICLDEFQFGSKAIKSKEDDMLDRPWMRLGEAPLDSNPLWVSGFVLELMKTFTNMSMAMMTLETETAAADESVSSQVDSDADLDWELQQNIWALTQVEEEDELTDEQVQLLYDMNQLQLSSPRSESPSSTQEDPNMLEWLYESMMARLVDLDLQGSQDQSSFGSLSETNLA